MLKKLWKDDSGIVALEYLLLATIVGLGLVVGLSAVEAALNVELTELGNSITALDQSYLFVTQFNETGGKAGTLVTDLVTQNELNFAPLGGAFDPAVTNAPVAVVTNSTLTDIINPTP
jgi:Flp pilus assembly pilin Flp